jgi:Na+-driven multidrug efflux pump
MVFLIVGSAGKVCFNLVFVAGLKMTVMGVALATIISWILMSFLGLRALLKNKGATRLKPSRLRFYGAELKEILIVGIPAGLQQALYSIANVIIASTVNSFGPEASTGISIANIFDGILYQIVTAPALAVMPYVSQNIGAGNVSRARRSVIHGMMITVAFGATAGALSAIFSAELSSMMSGNAAVIAYSQQKMVIISSTYFICGINNIFGEAMRGMGRPNLPTVATLIYMCFLRFVWVYALFPLVPNFTFLYLVWPVGWCLSIATLLPFYLSTFKKLKAQHEKKVLSEV